MGQGHEKGRKRKLGEGEGTALKKASKRLGMWGYVYASSVVLYVYLEQRAYRMILLHICSILGNCGCIWD